VHSKVGARVSWMDLVPGFGELALPPLKSLTSSRGCVCVCGGGGEVISQLPLNKKATVAFNDKQVRVWEVSCLLLWSIFKICSLAPLSYTEGGGLTRRRRSHPTTSRCLFGFWSGNGRELGLVHPTHVTDP
jgi:hypothetical protein